MLSKQQKSFRQSDINENAESLKTIWRKKMHMHPCCQKNCIKNKSSGVFFLLLQKYSLKKRNKEIDRKCNDIKMA